MGRRKSPPAPRWDAQRRRWRLRFTHEGQSYDFRSQSIGEREVRAAAVWAHGLLQEVYSGEFARAKAEGSDPEALLLEVAAAYLAEATGGSITPRTAAVRALHVKTHLAPAFPKLSDITHSSLSSYQAERLKEVRFATIKKELSTLRQILIFAETKGWIAELPRWPRRPGKSQGTAHPNGAKGFTRGFTEEMARKVIRFLPESTLGTAVKWPVRAYFEFLLETGLRPGTVTGLRHGKHWRAGAKHLRITADIDKNKYERDVPLTPRAIAILEGTEVQEGGRLFAARDFRAALRRAAKLAELPPEIAGALKPYDIRHARITHLVATGQVLGAGFMAGHLQMTTTNKYSHANQKQAEQLVALVSGSSGPSPEGSSPPPDKRASVRANAAPPPEAVGTVTQEAADLGCAKKRTRTSTGVTPLAPQGADAPRNGSEIRESLDTERSGALWIDPIDGQLPANRRHSLGALALAAIAAGFGLERRVA